MGAAVPCSYQTAAFFIRAQHQHRLYIRRSKFKEIL